MEIGVQLFGCMGLYNADPEAFLASIAKAGFTQAEPCVSFGEMPGLEQFAWKAEEIRFHTARLKKYGLSLSSCHVFAKDLLAALPEMIETAAAAGIRQYVIGFHGPVNKENLLAFKETCIRLSDALSAHGIGLWLHNGSAEIVSTLIDGVPAAQWLLEACGGKLGMQVDTGWVVYGGADLRGFMESIAPYVRSVHHKDLREIPPAGQMFVNTAIGDGIVDSAYASAFALEHHLGQIVDQDNSAGDMLADLTRSAAFLQRQCG